MSEQEQNDALQKAAEEDAPAESQTANEEETVEQTETQEEVDDKGVSYKNRYMESERKREELEDRLSNLESRMPLQTPYIPPQPSMIPPAQAVPNQPYDPKVEVEKFATNPESWFEQAYQKRRAQEKLQEADNFLAQADPYNYQRNAADVIAHIRNRRYDFNADPLGVTRMAFEEIKQLRQAASKPKPKETKEQETKRAQKIKKTTTVSGNKPAAPRQDNSKNLFDKALESGTEKDARNFFRDVLG